MILYPAILTYRGADFIVQVPHGANIYSMSEQLQEKKIISNKFAFISAGRLLYLINGGKFYIKSGEFRISNGMNYYEIVELLASNRYNFRSITVPEGLTVKQVVDILNQAKIPGDITINLTEGSLMPETYYYISTDTKDIILGRMMKDMDDFLSKSWKKNANPMLKTKEELISFASIVEKETGVEGERKIVSSVFTNRLATGMRLQSDPTIIYEITKGETNFGRKITKSDINFSTIYNTYKINGLPKYPISCPGKSSILASIAPAKTDFLYFVAVGDNSGRHIFAKNYQDHLVNVDKYRSNRVAREMAESNL